MALASRLFNGVAELEACAVNDSAHLIPGSRGHHVRLVQTALVYAGEKLISGKEYIDGTYGPSTAAAVLRYKVQRDIVNRTYQSRADNIVGKTTIARLDQDMVMFQALPITGL